MLVLSRKLGESLELPEVGVVLQVVALKKSKVQLGIDAPQQITVRRCEHAQDGFRQPQPSKQSENERLRSELAHVQTTLAALAELAETSQRSEVRNMVADAIARLRGVNRSIQLVMSTTSNPQSIGDLVTAREESISQQRGPASGENHASRDATNYVRQRPAGYQIRLCPNRCLRVA